MDIQSNHGTLRYSQSLGSDPRDKPRHHLKHATTTVSPRPPGIEIKSFRFLPIGTAANAAVSLLRARSIEPISKSSEEDNEAGELDKAEEVLSVVLPADEDATLPLYPGEEALDEPAPLVTA